MSFKHISTSVVACSKIIYLHLVNILVMPRYSSHTEVLIIKVYHKKVLLIPPNPNATARSFKKQCLLIAHYQANVNCSDICIYINSHTCSDWLIIWEFIHDTEHQYL